MRSILSCITLLFIISMPALAGNASPPRPAPSSVTAANCAALESVDFAAIQDAPTQVIAATLRKSQDGAITFCHVLAYVAPNIGIELGLPLDWNGKFFESGCAGYCGMTFFDLLCDGVLQKGYVCAASDSGHRASYGLGMWAYGSVQDEMGLAYRAAHVTAVAGKAIAAHLYGREPHRSYFAGCSTGGRQALLEAQRFPWDFDGIIAGAPSISVTGVHMQLLWNNRAMVDASGTPILSEADLTRLHRRVVAACDMNDGIADGLIGDPRDCAFDVASLRCAAGKSAECLDDRQIEAVRKIYAGPMTSRREPLLAGGVPPGSELNWTQWFVGMEKFVRDEFRYSAFQPAPGPTWELRHFDFDRDPRRLGMADQLYAADNPDLRRFKAAGGKLISFIGWADFGSPFPVLDYYETVEKTFGSRAATQDFFRLFVVPGMDHCTDGEGAFAIDYLGALEAWVERAEPPDVLLGAHEKVAQPGDWRKFWAKFPLPAARVAFTRPVYPYPLQTRYSGTGNSNEASHFRAVPREK